MTFQRFAFGLLLLCTLNSPSRAITVRWEAFEGGAGTTIFGAQPAIIVDLFVDTTATSHFASAGLFVDPALLPGVRYFQHPGNGDNGPLPENPIPDLMIGTDTRITTPDNAAGTINRAMVGTGDPVVGYNGVFNVVWSDVLPSTAEGRNLIARLTMFDVILGSTPVAGFVTSVEQPGVQVALPPIPVARIPEPSCIVLLTTIYQCLSPRRSSAARRLR